MKLRVGVIFGGSSVEHEISVISALQAITNIDKEKYEVIPIYISKDKDWYTGSYLMDISHYSNLDLVIKNSEKVILEKVNQQFWLLSSGKILNKKVKEIDIAFPIVHGQNVEDGTIAGYLETIGIPYVGSNVLASALGQDKVIMKQVFASSNIPVVDYVWFYDYEYELNPDKVLNDIAKLNYPVVVKPASLGSSVGINMAHDLTSLKKAITEALNYDSKIIVEAGVENLVEVNCSVLGNYEKQEVSAIEQVMSASNILTFKDKYEGNGKTSKCSKGMVSASRIIPAKISKELTKQIEDVSIQVFKALNLSGVCRIDFLINQKTNEIYVNEPNTIPGSLAFYLWEAKGKKYMELLDDIIKLGIKEYKRKKQKTTCFETNVLKNYQSGVKTNKIKQ